MDDHLKKACLKKAKERLEYILQIPYIVHSVESILDKYQYTDLIFPKISGKLTFEICNLEVTHFLTDGSTWVEVEVDLSRHHPTDLIFRTMHWQKDYEDIYTIPLLKFCDNLHMEAEGDLEDIVKLMQKRFEEAYRRLGLDVTVENANEAMSFLYELWTR